MTLITERLEVAFLLFDELAELFDESVFSSKLATLPSNTIGQQFWCVIGARESYIAGIAKGQWAGFNCSLDRNKTGNKAAVLEGLRNSAKNACDVLHRLGEPSEGQARLAVQLLEHEVQHHGQFIRYLYGLKIGVPKGWKERYHLD